MLSPLLSASATGLVAQAKAVFDATPLWVTIFVGLATLYWIITRDNVSGNLPPQFSVVWRLLTGKFKLEAEGPLSIIRSGYEQCGDIFRVKVAHRGITFVVGPAAKIFFGATDTELSQREVYHFTVPVFGKNIVYDAQPEIMVQQLKFIRQGLQSDKMKAYSGKIVMEVENYFSKWGQTGQVDLHEVLSEVTILTASRCLLGDEIRERLHTEFAELYKHLNDGMTPITVFFPYAPIKAHKDRDSARAQIVKLFSEVIQARRVIQQDPAAVRPIDFLQMLIDAEYRDGGRLNDDEICGLLLAALFAGQHTSSITSTWMGLCLINLGAKLMGDLRSEQKDVLGRSAGGQVTVEALEEMQLMHAVMKETLRLYSPLIMLMRKVKQPLEYTRESDGQTFVVPEGDIIISSPPVSHRLPEVFSDPETFDPYRFESGFSKRNEGAGKYQFSPFGGGRHTCLGERFAFLQIKTIWSVLVRNFNFELVDGVPPIDFTAIVAGPKGACRVKYTRLPKPIC